MPLTDNNPFEAGESVKMLRKSDFDKRQTLRVWACEIYD